MGLIANVRERFGTRNALREIEGAQARLRRNEVLAMERLAELELGLEDMGWQRFARDGEGDLTDAGRQKARQLARLMYLKHPLIRRAVNVQTSWVFGQGVQIGAKDPAVNEVIQDFLEDRGNRRALTGLRAMKEREKNLQLSGDLFLALFRNVSSGRVRVRVVPPGEVVDLETNPEDASEPWLFRRRWTDQRFDMESGSHTTEQREAYYVAWDWHGPDGTDTFPEAIGGVDIARGEDGEEVRLYHVKVGDVDGMRFGLPDVFAALEYARAYRDYLSDWATVARSLSRFAWKGKAPGRKVNQVKEALNTTLSTDSSETNPPAPAGAAAITPTEVEIVAMNKTGANVSPADGVMLRKMVASATDIPDTVLGSDPDMGNLATAKTLDRPTELAMEDRQTLWADVIADLCWYVVWSVVSAPNGRLDGVVSNVEGEARVELAPDPVTGEVPELGVDVTFPPILMRDVKEWVDAIMAASAKLPDQVIAGLLLEALEVPDADEVLADLFPEDEEPAPPVEDEEGGELTPPVTAESLLLESVRGLRDLLAAKAAA